MHDAAVSNLITSRSFEVNELPAKEGFALVSSSNGWILVGGGDDSGVLYGCLELANRIREGIHLGQRN
jgi:alpha-glucuronidase